MEQKALEALEVQGPLQDLGLQQAQELQQVQEVLQLARLRGF